MKLSTLSRTTLFHGVSVWDDTRSSVVIPGTMEKHCQKIAKTGFNPGRGVYFSTLERALSYRRDTENIEESPSLSERELDEVRTRGIVEIPSSGRMDGQDVLDNPPPSDVDSEVYEQWDLLHNAYQAWCFGDDIYSYEGYMDTFGDTDPYDAAQAIADSANIAPISPNRVITSGIAPSDMLGVYLFKREDDSMFRCSKVILSNGGTIGVGFVAREGYRT